MNVAVTLSPEDVEALALRTAELLADRLPTNGHQPYLTTAEAAELLRCEPQRIHDLRSAGRLPEPLKEGGRLLWRREDLVTWLEDGSAAL